MANGAEHRLGSGFAAGGAWAAYEMKTKGELSWQTPVAGAAGFLSGTLPDILEPALSPNHRQFCHSWAAVGIVGCGLYRLWKWKAKEDWEKLAKGAAIAVGIAYLAHLLMDACTPRGLPLI